MAKIRLRNGKIIGDFKKPYIVAEMNTSHFGNIETAKKMIDLAKDAGVSCVKFQSWSSESLYSKTFYDENPILKRIVTEFAFSEEQLLELANYCKELGIDFASTPYSKKEVDFLLQKCDAPFIKIASMDSTNYPYLEYIAKTGAPIILSTGLSDLSEIKKAVETIQKTGNESICILHCVSTYPTENSSVRLKNILGLRKEFPNYPIGFSDHSLGIELPTASVALGAALIEKHFTLDNSKIGMDNQMATEPKEMKKLVEYAQIVQVALGSEEKIVSQEILEQRKRMRRSMIVNKDLKKGYQLKKEDLDAKRPGTGIPPERMESLIGKTLTKDIQADNLILETDFE